METSFSQMSFNQGQQQQPNMYTNNNNNNNTAYNSQINYRVPSYQFQQPINKQASWDNTMNNGRNEMEDKKLQEKLNVKDIQIESLENEIQNLKKILQLNPNGTRKGDDDKISKHYGPIFTNLVSSLLERNEEYESLKRDYEELYLKVAMNLDGSNSITKDGRYDTETIAHKMLIRFEMLTKENSRMAKMLSYGRPMETDIELQLVEMENQELKERIKQLEMKK